MDADNPLRFGKVTGFAIWSFVKRYGINRGIANPSGSVKPIRHCPGGLVWAGGGDCGPASVLSAEPDPRSVATEMGPSFAGLRCLAGTEGGGPHQASQ